MDSDSSEKKGGGGPPLTSGPESQSLAARYKNALNIALKAKQARDEAIEKLEVVSQKNAKWEKRYDDLEKQYATTHEMLVALTDQKLKLAMEIDDLKKANTKQQEVVSNLSSMRDKFEHEAEAFKIKYCRISEENKQLHEKYEELKNKKETKLQADIKKLQDNNEHIKIICSNVTKEKLDIEVHLKDKSAKLSKIEKEHNQLKSFFSSKFGVDSNNVDWIKLLHSTKSETSDILVQTEESLVSSNSLENVESELKRVSGLLNQCIKEKELLDEEIGILNEKYSEKCSEVDVANSDRDNAISNLEELRIETQQLIENSENILADSDFYKREKERLEVELKTMAVEEKKLKEELNVALEQINTLKELNDYAQKDMQGLKEKIGELYECGVNSEKFKLLKEDLELAQSNVCVKDEEIKGFKEEINQLNFQLKELKCILDELKNENVSLQTDLTVSNKTIKSIKRSFCQLGMYCFCNLKKRKQLEISYLALCQNEDSLKSLLSSAEDKIQTLTEEMICVKENCDSLLMENLGLKDGREAASVKKSASGSSINIQSLEDALLKRENENTMLTQKLDESLGLIDVLSKEVNQVKENNCLLLVRVKQLQEQLEDKNCQGGELKKKMESALEELKESKKNYKIVTEELAECRMRIETLTYKVKEKSEMLTLREADILQDKEEISKLQVEKHNFEAHISAYQEMKSLFSTKSEEFNDLNSKYKSKEEELIGLKELYEKTNEELKYKQLELKESRKELENLKLVNEYHAKHIENMEKKQRVDKDNQGDCIKELQSKIECALSQNSELESLQAEFNKVSIELSIARGDLSKKESELSHLKQENERTKSCIVEVNEEFKNMSETIKAILKFELDIENCKSVEGLLAGLSELKYLLRVLIDKKVELNKHVEELEKSAESGSNKVVASLQSEIDCLVHQKTKLIEDLKAAMSMCDEQSKQLKSKIEIELALKLTTEQLEVCKKQLKEAEAFKKEYDQLSTELQDSKGRLDKIKALYRKSLSDAKFSDEIVSSQKVEIESLKESMKAHEQNIGSLKNELESVVHHFSDMQNSQLGSLEQEVYAKKAFIETCSKVLKEELECYCELAGTTLNTSTDLLNQINNLTQLRETFKNILKSNMENINAEKENIRSIRSEAEALKTELTQAHSSNNQLSQEITDLKEELNDKSKKVQEVMEVLEAVREEYNSGLKVAQESLKEKTTALDECNRIWIARLTGFKGSLNGLKQAQSDISKNLAGLQSFVIEQNISVNEKLQTNITAVTEGLIQTSKQDLLKEMQSMNQVIKDRGEMISKLQEVVVDSKSKFKEATEGCNSLKKELDTVTSEVVSKDEIIKAKDCLISDLESQISRLKELHDTSMDTDGLSSSTISKAEEFNRLKDLEESFEEKYAKMKLLAMKLKKRNSELAQCLESEKSMYFNEKTELLEKIQTLSGMAKNTQKIQESFDKLFDEVEIEKEKVGQLKSALDEKTATVESLKSKLELLEKNGKAIPFMKKKIDSLEAQLKEAQKKIQTIQKEKEVEVIKYNEIQNECVELKSKMQELSNSLEVAKKQRKANSLLELEIQHYEKVVVDLSLQINKEKQEAERWKTEVETLASLKKGLEEQIKLLEDQIKVEEGRADNMNDQLSSQGARVEELMSEVDDYRAKLRELTKNLQEETNKYESLIIQSSKVSSDFSKRECEMIAQNDLLQEHVHTLESTLMFTKQELVTSKAEVERIMSEYENYKVRAQSVLAKKNENTVPRIDSESMERIEKLTHELEVMKMKLETAQSDLETTKCRNSTYKLEKERGDLKIHELMKTLQTREKELDTLSAEFRSYKLSNETLIQCYKTEIKEKDMSHKDEVSDLNQTVEDLQLKLKEVESLVSPPSEVGEMMSEFQTSSPAGGEILQEREDGEGSESVPSPKMRRRSVVVSLDTLLNSPMEEEDKISRLHDEVNKLQSDLMGYELRMRHMSSLLSEAEKDSARSLHQNSVLKEEVRRLERSLERQPHVANTEYLKNIMFKFLTLRSGDERLRLVPVLDTILKLSPDETTLLNNIAKSEGSSGLGGYLSYFTGL